MGVPALQVHAKVQFPMCSRMYRRAARAARSVPERRGVNGLRASIALAAVAALFGACPACGSSLPHPSEATQPDTAFERVPYPPPAAHVETIPPRPHAGAVWIDGGWLWQGRRWVWQAGGWVDAPSKVTADGRLMFAPAIWRAPDGREMAPPPPIVVEAHSSTSGDNASAGMKPEETQTNAPGATPSPPAPSP
jgi:hypothetical protein